MRQLKTIAEAAHWLQERVQGAPLRTDSRSIAHGEAFIAWPGAASDGRRYVQASLDKGARACLVEAAGAAIYGFDDERIASFEGLKAASGPIAAEYFGHPSRALDVLAVTGTNGKTSSTWWLAQCLNLLRKNELLPQIPCGIMGTLGIGNLDRLMPTGLTTPDPVMLQAELARQRINGTSACAIEASSIGIVEDRLAGLCIRAALFTNFTQDHLDYHGSMEQYWLAKQSLFDWPDLKVAIINIDDPLGTALAERCKNRGLEVWTLSLKTSADLRVNALQHLSYGVRFEVVEDKATQAMSCPVLGEYNVSNLLGVVGVLRSLGYSLKQIADSMAQCTAVPGRMQMVSLESDVMAVVDYAHTPDALSKALLALRMNTQARGGQLWCVFGCGGDRDASKRPLMAQAAELADQIVLTSDNPRSESAQSIAQQIKRGFQARRPVHLELDRARAIEYALLTAQPGDTVLIAGKGHEITQEILGVKTPFSDVDQARKAIELRAKKYSHQGVTNG